METTLLSLMGGTILTLLVFIYFQWLTKRSLERYNERLLKDSQNYRGLYENASKHLEKEEKDNDHLRYVIKLQDVLIDELNSTIGTNNIEVVDPVTLTE